MESWLYGLLFGLGISSLVLAFGCSFVGPTIIGISDGRKSMFVTGIVLCSILPLFVIIGVVLISVCLNVGKI